MNNNMEVVHHAREITQVPRRLFSKRVFDTFGKRIFAGNKVVSEVKTFACYTYVSQGSSLRRTRALPSDLGLEVNHISIWHCSSASTKNLRRGFFGSAKDDVLSSVRRKSERETAASSFS